VQECAAEEEILLGYTDRSSSALDLVVSIAASDELQMSCELTFLKDMLRRQNNLSALRTYHHSSRCSSHAAVHDRGSDTTYKISNRCPCKCHVRLTAASANHHTTSALSVLRSSVNLLSRQDSDSGPCQRDTLAEKCAANGRACLLFPRFVLCFGRLNRQRYAIAFSLGRPSVSYSNQSDIA
jgi:hypothetical protein